MNDNIKLGVLFALATAVVGSSSAAIAKVVSGELNAYMLVFLQFFIGVLILVPRYMHQGNRLWQTGQIKTHLIRGLGGVIGFYAFYQALQSVPLVDVVLLRNTAPLFVPLLAWAWLRVIVPHNRWIPLLIGFVGVVLVLKTQMSSDPVDSNWGYVFGLLSGIGYAVSMVSTRVLSRTENADTIIFYYFVISFLISVPLAVTHWQAVPAQLWPAVLAVGVSVSLAMWLYTKAYEYAKPSIISPISYFSVVFAGLIGWFFWEHVPPLLSFVGMLLVVIAGMMTVYLSQRKQPSA